MTSTVKDFLNRVRRQECEVLVAEQELKKLRYEIYNLKSPPLKERVQTSSQGGIEKLVEAEEMAMERVNEEWDSLIKMRMAAKDIIRKLEDEKERAILRRRYILGQKWETVAVEMSLDLKWVYKLHGRALYKLESMPDVILTIKSDYGPMV